MNWYAVMQALCDYLMQHNDLSDVAVGLGAHLEIPERRSIELIRGHCTPPDGPARNSSMTLYLECWEFDGSDNPCVGYQRLADLEEKAFVAVRNASTALHAALGRGVTVLVGETEPDGDIFRPSIGSRTRITLSWY